MNTESCINKIIRSTYLIFIWFGGILQENRFWNESRTISQYLWQNMIIYCYDQIGQVFLLNHCGILISKKTAEQLVICNHTGSNFNKHHTQCNDNQGVKKLLRTTVINNWWITVNHTDFQVSRLNQPQPADLWLLWWQMWERLLSFYWIKGALYGIEPSTRNSKIWPPHEEAAPSVPKNILLNLNQTRTCTSLFQSITDVSKLPCSGLLLKAMS